MTLTSFSAFQLRFQKHVVFFSVRISLQIKLNQDSQKPVRPDVLVVMGMSHRYCALLPNSKQVTAVQTAFTSCLNFYFFYLRIDISR